MAEPTVHPTDAAICRLLAAAPLPTGAIAARLAIPDRTARYRLGRLRLAGTVLTGSDGVHRLVVPVGSAQTAPEPPLAATGTTAEDTGDPSSGRSVAGPLAVVVVLAAFGIGLAAILVRPKPRDPPPPNVGPDPWGPPTSW